jgi:AcrR family transcriptional regulator
MADDHSHPGLAPLAPALAAAFAAATSGGGKAERTQSALVRAAVQVLGTRGVAAATIQEIAQVAGMTPATVYNHFASKEALLERVGVVLAVSLSRAIAASQANIPDGAQRVVIGQRRYVQLAAESPGWALLLLDLATSNPMLLKHIEVYPLTDLRLAMRQKRIRIPSEAAGMDVLVGASLQAMRRVALGEAPPRHDVAVATVVLRALGMDADEAAAVARRPLPDLPMPEADPMSARTTRKRAVTR